MQICAMACVAHFKGATDENMLKVTGPNMQYPDPLSGEMEGAVQGASKDSQ